MHPIEEQDGQPVPVDLELPVLTPGSPLVHPCQSSDASTNPHKHEPGFGDTILDEDLEETSRVSALDSPLMSIEAGNDIHSAGPWQENFKYHATDSQNTDEEFEIRAFRNLTPVGALSPASERFLQNANIPVSAPSPDAGSRFIQRHDAHEDVMEEIKSAFKFAKKENTHGPDKATSTKANRKASEIAKGLNTSESAPVCKYNDPAELQYN